MILQGIDLWACGAEGGVAPVAAVSVVVVDTMEEGMDIQGGDVVITQTISPELLVKKIKDLLSA